LTSFELYCTFVAGAEPNPECKAVRLSATVVYFELTESFLLQFIAAGGGGALLLVTILHLCVICRKNPDRRHSEGDIILSQTEREISEVIRSGFRFKIGAVKIVMLFNMLMSLVYFCFLNNWQAQLVPFIYYIVVGGYVVTVPVSVLLVLVVCAINYMLIRDRNMKIKLIKKYLIAILVLSVVAWLLALVNFVWAFVDFGVPEFSRPAVVIVTVEEISLPGALMEAATVVYFITQIYYIGWVIWMLKKSRYFETSKEITVKPDKMEYLPIKLLPKKLGEGNFGEVWSATFYNSPVAAKKISIKDAKEVLLHLYLQGDRS
jgi:hypothetical protein